MAPAPKKKALKIGRALKRLPARAVGRGNSGGAFAPIAGEQPIVILRVQVLSCTNLLAKDRNGLSDPYVSSLFRYQDECLRYLPHYHAKYIVLTLCSLSACRFVVVSLLGTKHQTHVSKRTVNPTYNPKDSTFDFPIYLSLADKLGVVELVVWDKDMLKKDYLGEAWIPLEDWFRDGNAFAFEDLNNKVCDYVRLARAGFLVLFRSLRASIPYAGDPASLTRLARTWPSCVSALTVARIPWLRSTDCLPCVLSR